MTSQIPHHVNPTTPATTAMAPYNFVPLPQAIFEVKDGLEVSGQKVKPWECHNQFVPGTHSGWLDLKIEALTPVFIRGAVRQNPDGTWDESKDARQRSAPFLDHLGRPTIPGSSLRGMIRHLVEIMSFSKIQPVSRKQPFFRSMTPSRISDAYRSWFIHDLGELTSGIDVGTQAAVRRKADGYEACVRAGIVRTSGSRRTIVECGLARIERTALETVFSAGQALISRKQSRIPNWNLQHKTVYVTADPQPRDYFFQRQVNQYGKQRHPDLYLRFRRIQQVTAAQKAGMIEGVSVITGDMKFKHLEFVFLTGESLGTIEIPEDKWERFHDDDQMTQWQEMAFERGQPSHSHRFRNGHLRDGEPVFFLCDPSKVDTDNPQGLVFFGRAQMFRFPYDESPASLIPKSLSDAGLDLAEAMFGRVATIHGDKSIAIKGRVFFEDSVVTAPGQWLAPKMVPQILGSPKVTAYQQYLTQNGKADAKQHTTYIQGDTTTIRGHKLYWHRWDDACGLEQATLQSDRAHDTQTTLIQPVAEKNAVGQPTIFHGRIRFENLTDIELGAFLIAMNLPEGCAHKIGMAKPLGLGSIRITATLQLINRAARYQSWGDLGMANNDGHSFVTAFTSAIQQHATQSNEAKIVSKDGLRNIARLDALFCLLRFDGRPDRKKTEYLSLEQFKPRHVLPTPHQIGGEPEPNWPGPTPSPGRDLPSHQSSAGRYSSRSTSEPSAASASPPPKPAGKSGKFKETAHFVRLLPKKPGQAEIKLESAPAIACTGINVGLQLKPNDSIEVEVEYDDGLPQQAKFKRRS